MKQTIESKTADTILELPEELTIGGKTYKVAPASTATLIMVSAAISRLPQMKLDSESLAEDCLREAQYCTGLGEIVAILILGAKHINDIATHEKGIFTRPWWAFWRKKTSPTGMTAKDVLAKTLLEDLSPRELNNISVQLLQRLDLGDFFGLTTFLNEINMIRPTKVVTETTAFGL